MKSFTKNIKNFNFLLNLILVLLISATVGNAQEINYKVLTVENTLSQSGFYPFGGYKMLGKKTPVFSDFNNFTLEFTELPKDKQPLKLVGAVIFNAKEDSSTIYQFETLAISDQEFSFSTEKIDGIHYEFKGNFLKKGELVKYNEKKTAVLQGTLKQFKDTQESARISARFSFVVWKASYYKTPRK